MNGWMDEQTVSAIKLTRRHAARWSFHLEYGGGSEIFWRNILRELNIRGRLLQYWTVAERTTLVAGWPAYLGSEACGSASTARPAQHNEEAYVANGRFIL